MSRTHRAHLPATQLAKRGPAKPKDPRNPNKPAKQRRVNDRVALRKEYR